MKNLLLALLLTCCSGLAFAQTSLTATTPEPVRYLDPVFTEWTTDFGEYQPGYKYKIYMPAHDTEDKRPVMIFYTGGGTTDISKLNNICTEIVQLGYVTVAAQYKLTVGDGFTEQEQKESVIKTYELIRFLRENATAYGIKRKEIFGVGTSAGGITWINAGITANNTGIPFYDGYKIPKIKGSLIGTASLSGAAVGSYFYLINSTGVPNNFYNGALDPLIPVKSAQETYEAQFAAGIPSLIKIYPLSDHTLGEHDDIYYNPDYGIIPTFYSRLKIKTPKP